MVLTNMAVAQQVAVHFSEQALLRRHDTPLERRLVSRYIYFCVSLIFIPNYRPLSQNVHRGWVTRWTRRLLEL